jgi:hypothetical protein
VWVEPVSAATRCLEGLLQKESIRWIGHQDRGQDAKRLRLGLSGLLVVIALLTWSEPAHLIPVIILVVIAVAGLRFVGLGNPFLWSILMQRMVAVVTDHRVLTIVTWPNGRLARIECLWPKGDVGVDVKLDATGRGTVQIRSTRSVNRAGGTYTFDEQSTLWSVVDPEGARRAICDIGRGAASFVADETADLDPTSRRGRIWDPNFDANSEISKLLKNGEEEALWLGRPDLRGGSLHNGTFVEVWAILVVGMGGALMIFLASTRSWPDPAAVAVALATMVLGGYILKRRTLINRLTKYAISERKLIVATPGISSCIPLDWIMSARFDPSFGNWGSVTFSYGSTQGEDGLIHQETAWSTNGATNAFKILSKLKCNDGGPG